MKLKCLVVLSMIVFAGCDRPKSSPNAAPGGDQQPSQTGSLADARRGFQTKLVRQVAEKEPVPKPPAQLFSLVKYDSSAGKIAAYLSKPPKDKKKHPAIIWIFGGFDNGIGETAWEKAEPGNDQSASAFRRAGIVMMYPSLRGGNDSPGFNESFFGEVDDVLAAANFLAKQEFVDPKRIYLGGHSTGGTLVLLAAESSDRFRAVFSFGPVEDVAGYGPDNLHFDLSNKREVELRAPGRWLHAVKNPTFVFEGTAQGNIDSLRAMQRSNKNALVHFYPVAGATHFSLLAPVTELIAAKINRDDGETCNIDFTEKELLFKPR